MIIIRNCNHGDNNNSLGVYVQQGPLQLGVCPPACLACVSSGPASPLPAQPHGQPVLTLGSVLRFCHVRAKLG